MNDLKMVKTEQYVDKTYAPEVLIASNFINPNIHKGSSRKKENNHILKCMSNQYSLSKVNDEYHVECEGIDTAVTTIKVLVPVEFYEQLNELHRIAKSSVKRMLSNRTENSTKYYKELPSLISKGLLNKYQRNKKCKSVKNVVLPICGDKGDAIKISDGGVKVRIFKKSVIPVTFRQPVTGFIRHAEFFKKNKKWIMRLSYNTPVVTDLTFTSVIGVDRNSRGNIAVAAHEDGQVRKLGIDAGAYQYNEGRRRAHLQSKRKFQLCKKISGTQARRIKDENHKVSRAVVDFAKTHRSAIVLENLSGVRKGKISSYTKKSQWSYFQLQQFVSYKAALLGVPVFFVDPAYTSKQCSKCGEINNPRGKQFKCIKCDHFDHRDANAAFNIAQRFYESSFGSSVSKVRHIGEPQTIQCHEGTCCKKVSA